MVDWVSAESRNESVHATTVVRWDGPDRLRANRKVGNLGFCDREPGSGGQATTFAIERMLRL